MIGRQSAVFVSKGEDSQKLAKPNVACSKWALLSKLWHPQSEGEKNGERFSWAEVFSRVVCWSLWFIDSFRCALSWNVSSGFLAMQHVCVRVFTLSCGSHVFVWWNSSLSFFCEMTEVMFSVGSFDSLMSVRSPWPFKWRSSWRQHDVVGRLRSSL